MIKNKSLVRVGKVQRKEKVKKGCVNLSKKTFLI